MAAAQGGDRDAMDVLLRRHHGRIWAVCRRITGNDADAADATQEAMLLLVRRLGTFDGRSRFTTWAHRVTTNACLDELRRRGRRPTPGLPDDDVDDPRTTASTDAPVDTEVAGRLAIDDALALLPDEFRVPVVLRDVAGHDYGEIAEILGIPAGTVRSRIARGRGRLAAILGELPVDPPVVGNQPAPDARPSHRP